MSKAISYTIPHIGLKKDVHEYEFLLDEEFFKKHENNLINDPRVKVNVVFDKTTPPYTLDFQIDGSFLTVCDKCAADLRLPLKGEYRVFIKFDSEVEETTDENLEILFLSRDEPEIDLEPLLYDFTNLCVPYTNLCEKPGKTEFCDMEVIKLLDKYQQEEQKDENMTDPRWEGLNKLKDLN